MAARIDKIVISELAATDQVQKKHMRDLSSRKSTYCILRRSGTKKKQEISRKKSIDLETVVRYTWNNINCEKCDSLNLSDRPVVSGHDEFLRRFFSTQGTNLVL